MSGKIGHPEMKPGEYPQERTDSAWKGTNYGMRGPHPERNNPRTAYDIKELHRQLHDFPDDVLKQIPVMPEGARLEEGARYVDLHEPTRHEFTASGGMVAEAPHWYVPKELVAYQVWNKLLGVTNPERTGEGNLPG